MIPVMQAVLNFPPERLGTALFEVSYRDTLLLDPRIVAKVEYGPARQLTLYEHDQPVLQVLTSDLDASPAALLAWLRCRWRIENVFKYLTAHHGIDWLCHYGADIGTGCSAPIYAAAAGTVIYAGPLGTYGNFVKIDNGGGIATGYAHIRPGGIGVDVGLIQRCRVIGHAWTLATSAGSPPTRCRSSITYLPLGLKSASRGVRSLTA